MKKIVFLLLVSFNLSAMDYTIRISQEVIRAMDLSPELAARLSGGDIIGNGGGLVEQEFRYAYRRLFRIVNTCKSSAICPFAGQELNSLIKIADVADKYVDDKDRLIFLSEQSYPGFFQDSEDSQIRIAKTAFIPGAPIFINLDMLYKDNLPAIDFSSMISILVHELGHQTGIKSHSQLDDMGAKLRDYLTQDTHVSRNAVGDAVASVFIFNLLKMDHFSEVFFSYKGKIVSLTSDIRDIISCNREGSISVGYAISNPHWNRLRSERGKEVLGYNSWVRVKCLELATSAIWTEDADLEIEFEFQNGQFVNHSLSVKN